MHPEKSLGDELLEVLSHRTPNAHRVRQLTQEIDRQNKQAAAVTKRLLGETGTQASSPVRNGVCNNPHHGFGAHPHWLACEDWHE